MSRSITPARCTVSYIHQGLVPDHLFSSSEPNTTFSILHARQNSHFWKTADVGFIENVGIDGINNILQEIGGERRGEEMGW